MSVPSTTNRVSYTGDGTTSAYDYTFRIFSSTDLLVTVKNTSTNAETTLTITTDYTVDGVGESAGGTVTLVDASQVWLDGDGDLLSTYTLTIRRIRPITQTFDIRNQGPFLPEGHEDAFDKATMVDQQQQDELDRSIKLAETLDPSSFDLTLPATIGDSAGQAVVVNSSGDGFEFAVSSSAGADSIPMSDVEYLTSADSPKTLTSSDRGKVFSCDTSGGAISIVLPAISGLTLSTAFVFTVKKTSSDSNNITITPDGSETIEGAASYVIGNQHAGTHLIPDVDQSPDDWTRIDFGPSGASATGGQLTFFNSDGGPLEGNDGGVRHWAWDYQASGQYALAHLIVGESYVAGQQITLEKGSYYTSATSGNVYLRAQAALIQPGTTAIESDFSNYTNIRTTTNTEDTADGTTNELQTLAALDITDSSGEINSVAVSPGDHLFIRIYRDTANESSSAAADLKLVRTPFEVKYT